MQHIESKSAAESVKPKKLVTLKVGCKNILQILNKFHIGFDYTSIRIAALDFGIKECFPGSNLHY